MQNDFLKILLGPRYFVGTVCVYGAAGLTKCAWEQRELCLQQALEG